MAATAEKYVDLDLLRCRVARRTRKRKMKLYFRPGSKSGLAIRIVQAIFALAAIFTIVNSHPANKYSVFRYFTVAMSIQVCWSCAAACLNVYCLCTGTNLFSGIYLTLLLLGEWFIALVTLSTVCSSGAVVLLYSTDIGLCREIPQECKEYTKAVTYAFLAYISMLISLLVLLWLRAR